MTDPPSPELDAHEQARWTLLGEQVHGRYTRELARTVGGTVAEETPEAVYFRTGLPASTYNGALIVGRPAHLAPIVQRARELCGTRVPWGLSLREDLWSTHRAGLEAEGFHDEETQPAMVLPSLDRQAPPLPPGLRIEAATTPEQLGCFLATGARGFGFPGGALRRFLRPAALQAQLRVPHSHWLVGLLEGQPVATAMSVVDEGVSYIAWVSTVPEHRKKGYGEALTWQAALAGRQDGARSALLRASKMGEPVYRRMGFRTLATYHAIVAPDRSPWQGLRTVFWFLGVSLWYATVHRRLETWPEASGSPVH